MKIAKTKSSFPLVIGIVGGIIAIIGGACVAFAGELMATALDAIQQELPNFNLGLYTAIGYLILIVGISALIVGCMAKNFKFGSLILTIIGGVYLILFVVLMIIAGGFPFVHLIISLLFILGGITGMKAPAEEEVPPAPIQ